MTLDITQKTSQDTSTDTPLTASADPQVTPLEAWYHAAWPHTIELCQHLKEVGVADETVINKVIENGLQHGMRPARALQAAGLLTFDNWYLMIPPTPTAEDSLTGSDTEVDDNTNNIDYSINNTTEITADTDFAGTSIDSIDGAVNTQPDSTSTYDGPQALFYRNIDMEMLQTLDINQISRLGMLPYRRHNNGTIEVATSIEKPHPIELEEMRTTLTDTFHINPNQIKFVWCEQGQVSTCIQQAKLALGVREEDETEVEQSTKAALENYNTLIAATNDSASNQSGETLARLLLEAIEREASDIHIFGTRSVSGGSRYQARIRVDGSLSLVTEPDGSPLELSTAVGKSIMSRISTVGSLKEDQRSPRSGRFEIALPDDPGKAYDLRVEITPQYGQGHLAVLRLLSVTEKPLALETIYPPNQSDLAARIMGVLGDMRAGGLFLVCGATGSGKTTLLASTMARLNDKSKHLLTIEHPIERRIDGVRQMQVEPNTGMTFISAIESAMRLDPDIIMIGELRSAETVKTAIQAAETGHMVLSTIHVTSAAAVPSRFRGLGIDSNDLANVLHGVLAQNLVATTCDKCVRVGKPAKECGFCEGTGWRGRAAVGEIMHVTPEIRRLIAENASSVEIETASGHLPKTHHAAKLVHDGYTTVEEIADKLGASAAAETAKYAAAFNNGTVDVAATSSATQGH